jgi:hypothetical protein
LLLWDFTQSLMNISMAPSFHTSSRMHLCTSLLLFPHGYTDW